MYMNIWRYEVPPECREEFERLYGARGEWAVFLSKARGFLGVSLLADVARPGEYVTLDRWESEAHFESFRSAPGPEYDALDTRGARLTVSERRLGGLLVPDAPA